MGAGQCIYLALARLSGTLSVEAEARLPTLVLAPLPVLQEQVGRALAGLPRALRSAESGAGHGDKVWPVWGHLLREVALAGGQAAGRAARLNSAVGAARPTAALGVNLELAGDGGAAGVGLAVLLHSTVVRGNVVPCAGGPSLDLMSH